MKPITIPFDSNSLGRIEFLAHMLTGDFKSFGVVRYKLDSGSDFTTISCDELNRLGYTREFLEKCPFYGNIASLATHENQLKLQYITNVSIKFGNREIQGCRVFFALDTQLRNLFGGDILKYFNWEVNYDKGLLRLVQTEKFPKFSEGETPLHIYSIEKN